MCYKLFFGQAFSTAYPKEAELIIFWAMRGKKRNKNALRSLHNYAKSWRLKGTFPHFSPII